MSAEKIRELNDQLRIDGRGGKVVMTSSVQARGAEFIMTALRKLREVDTFTEDTDPYQEHDFGSLEVLGEKLFWKIDYYDTRLEYRSEDPADPTKTTRVLTLMLASDY
jgi:hypothetical protein